MAHRSHLFSLRLGHALRKTLFEDGFTLATLYRDLLAGLSVGIIAIPLSMALAIASGVAPQYGLYTAIIAGIIIPLAGGSRYSVSGPTAAFVVILYPVVQHLGLAGLLVATTLAGFMLMAMAFLRLGRFIEYIPESVTLGFTTGIAVVIATLQIKDFFGLNDLTLPTHYIDRLVTLMAALPTASWATLFVASTTLAVMVLWPKLKTKIPPHLIAVIVGSLLALYCNRYGLNVATIGSTFQYVLPDGAIGQGVPSVLPSFSWPWNQHQLGETELKWTWPVAQELLAAAFAIAMLAAIESLLCAVVLDSVTKTKHSANSELLGQGIGNVIAPFFGGITATAAIARSIANLEAGAFSPLSGVIHAITVGVALLFLAPILRHLPMASMAALLLVVAWNMSELKRAKHLLKTAPKADVLVFLTCLSLTILFDMVVAITAGIVLASLLFMKEIAEMTRVYDITGNHNLTGNGVPEHWVVYKINGPLFFAAADRIFGDLAAESRHAKGIVLYLDGVSILDAGGVSALYRFIAHCQASHIKLYLADFQFQPLKTLARAGFRPDNTWVKTFSTLSSACAAAQDQTH